MLVIGEPNQMLHKDLNSVSSYHYRLHRVIFDYNFRTLNFRPTIFLPTKTLANFYFTDKVWWKTTTWKHALFSPIHGEKRRIRDIHNIFLRQCTTVWNFAKLCRWAIKHWYTILLYLTNVYHVEGKIILNVCPVKFQKTLGRIKIFSLRF